MASLFGLTNTRGPRQRGSLPQCVDLAYILLYIVYLAMHAGRKRSGIMTEERRVYTNDDAGNAAVGASTLISTIVWAIVVLVVLAVGLYALHVYVHMF